MLYLEKKKNLNLVSFPFLKKLTYLHYFKSKPIVKVFLLSHWLLPRKVTTCVNFLLVLPIYH